MAKANVPNAWDDDDWEAQADRLAKEDDPEMGPESGPGLSKPDKPDPAVMHVPKSRKERLEEHQKEQAALWNSAENPSQEVNYMAMAMASSTAPLAATTTTFKEPVTLLSRKPVIARRDPVTGMQRLALDNNGNEDDDDDDDAKQNLETADQIRARQQRERDEKQKQYDEARAKIFGESSPMPSSGPSTPGTVTPPPGSNGANRARGGRGRGRSRGRGGGGNNSNRTGDDRRATPQPLAQTKELYDPSYSPRPGLAIQKRQGGNASTPQQQEGSIIREPLGPDSSRGRGFGFGRRGGSQASTTPS